MSKLYLVENVYEMAKRRIDWCLDNFEKYAVAYSGGKDSTVLLYLTLEFMPKDRLKDVYIYFVDKESNLISTKDYILRQFDYIAATYPEINLMWICLPLKEINSLSFYEPFYICWDKAAKDKWVYDMPDRPFVINEDNNLIKDFGYDVEVKQVYGAINNYISNNGEQKLCVFVGLRADESLNRFRAVTKKAYFGQNYLTQIKKNIYNAYPIYDWDFRDIWKYHYDNSIEVNPIYKLLYIKGVFKREMRISQSFAGVPKKTLPLYRELEPESFERFSRRVKGVNSLTHIDLEYIKQQAVKVDYDFLMQTLPDEFRERILKSNKNTKDKETIKAILNGDIRLKRKAQPQKNTEKLKEKYKNIIKGESEDV
jgi:predicted phosphoadenosine phosphosulfate sulfurtransferase